MVEQDAIWSIFRNIDEVRTFTLVVRGFAGSSKSDKLQTFSTIGVIGLGDQESGGYFRFYQNNFSVKRPTPTFCAVF